MSKRDSVRANSSSPLLNILSGRTHGVIRRSEVALVERADLVRFERPDDCMEHAAVVEEDEVLLVPVVRVDELHHVTHEH